jgi:hypothetical protein
MGAWPGVISTGIAAAVISAGAGGEAEKSNRHRKCIGTARWSCSLNNGKVWGNPNATTSDRSS